MAIKTFTTGEVLTAADTNTYLNNGGLVYLNVLQLTGQSNGSINNVFTSDYANYRLEFNFGAASGNIAYYLRLRAGGVDETGAAAYRYAYRGLNSTGGSEDVSSNGANALYITNVPTTAGRSFTNIDLFSPQAASTYTVLNVNSQFHDAGGIMWRGGGGFVLVNTQFDSFTIGTLSASTATVTCRIYGYRQA